MVEERGLVFMKVGGYVVEERGLVFMKVRGLVFMKVLHIINYLLTSGNVTKQIVAVLYNGKDRHQHIIN